MSPLALDARQRRTQRALTDAILRLATDQPVREISMAQLAREAGVHRTTLYQHLSSPADWLADVLRDELDQVRDTHLDLPRDGDLQAATRDVVLAVLDHLEFHAPIYQRELTEPGSTLRAMLGSHFAASVEALIEAHELGPSDLGVPPALFRAVAARWIADATVGAMTVWLHSEARDPAAYLRMHTALLPAWWPAPR